MTDTTALSALAAIRIHAPPSAVFDAFVDAMQMSRFWFSRRDDGLRAGESVRWFLGDGADAISFSVQVKEVQRPERLVIEWPGEEGETTQVSWLFEEVEGGDTVLTIEEAGFRGTDQQVIERVLDSTRGFNQVIVAVKALLEHGTEINVVAAHV